MSSEDMEKWLNQWLEVSQIINENNLSLLLHCPILLAYNITTNWPLIYSYRWLWYIHIISYRKLFVIFVCKNNPLYDEIFFKSWKVIRTFWSSHILWIVWLKLRWKKRNKYHFQRFIISKKIFIKKFTDFIYIK